MSFQTALQKASSNFFTFKDVPLRGLVELIEKASRAGGEFPTASTTVEAVRAAAARTDYSVPALAAAVRSDPLLASRIVATANSSLYLRGKPSESVEQALLITGPKRILTLINEIGPVAEFSQFFAGRAVSQVAFQEQLLVASMTAELIEHFSFPSIHTRDLAVMCANIFMLPVTLFAYFRPHFYSACRLDTLDPDTTFNALFEKCMGKTRSMSAIGVAKQLSFSEESLRAILALERPVWGNREWKAERESNWAAIAGAVGCAVAVVNEVMNGLGPDTVEAVVKEQAMKLSIKRSIIEKLVGELPAQLERECDRIGLVPIRLPSFLDRFHRDDTVKPERAPNSSLSERLNPFLVELKVCTKLTPGIMEFGRTPQAISATVQALLRGLGFDRVIVFQVAADRRTLVPVYLEGSDARQNVFLTRPATGGGIDAKAVGERKTAFFGEPVFKNGWPYVALPIIQSHTPLGVIYADRITKAGTLELSAQEQMACVALGELWYDVPLDFM